MNNTDYNLIAFKAISDFVKQLGENFGDKNHSLKLYEHLINKTTLSHDKAISKHIEAFRDFCVNNREAITNKDASKLDDTKVEYSSRVYIDFITVFKEADSDSQNVIWKHLLTISALVDPAGQAKKILMQNKDSSKEANFLNDVIEKVEATVNKNTNPLEAVGTLMSSGVFNDLISGMNNGIQSGELDIGKLMGTVQTMCSSLTGNMGGSDSKDNPMNMINSLMSNMGSLSNNNPGEAPDLSNISNLLGPMLSGLNVNGGGGKSLPTIEEINNMTLPKSEDESK